MSHTNCATAPRSVSLFLAIAFCCAAGACAMRPLTLRPGFRPFEFVVVDKYEPLHMISFVDEAAEEERSFGEQQKRFSIPPIDVFNDALLLSLRKSEGFELVDRNQPVAGGGYVLEGRLIALGTEERFFKLAGIASTMGISAICVTEFRLKDSKTGEVLLEESISSTGEKTSRAVLSATGVFSFSEIFWSLCSCFVTISSLMAASIRNLVPSTESIPSSVI